MSGLSSFSGAVPYPRGSEPHPARQVFWLAPSACLPVPAGQWLKSMRSFAELTATGIAPDSHRCSLLIPGRQPPAGNLARYKYRRCFSFGRAPRLFFMNILSTKKRGELQVPRVVSVGVRHPGRPPEFRPAGRAQEAKRILFGPVFSAFGRILLDSNCYLCRNSVSDGMLTVNY